MTKEPRTPTDFASGPHLYLVLESHRPSAPPARVRLDDLDEITFGRGRPRAFRRNERPIRSLDIRLEDPWMSTLHARMSRIFHGWVLEDAGSKNGCLVNGVARPRAELCDGDILEIGRTFFVFREAAAIDPEEPPVRDGPSPEAPLSGLSTMVPSLERMYERLAMVARSRLSVLVEGETGTGKEVVTRAVHAMSGRTGEFVPVNCGGLPRDLVEGEFFGHRKGAYSGAIADNLGLVRAADRGTLFLDEIGDLPLPAQAALLRVLQEREVRPVGSPRAIPVDLRVVAATNKPLDRMVEAGEFRADLLNRLTGHRVELPPLRARREDLGLLLATQLERADPRLVQGLQIHPRAVRALMVHAWPGNIRELEKAVSAALVLAQEGSVIELHHLPDAVQRALDETAAARRDADEALRERLLGLLRQHGGNVAAVARAMGKARMQIQRWMKRYGIDPKRFRP